MGFPLGSCHVGPPASGCSSERTSLHIRTAIPTWTLSFPLQGVGRCVPQLGVQSGNAGASASYTLSSALLWLLVRQREHVDQGGSSECPLWKARLQDCLAQGPAGHAWGRTVRRFVLLDQVRCYTRFDWGAPCCGRCFRLRPLHPVRLRCWACPWQLAALSPATKCVLRGNLARVVAPWGQAPCG